MIGYKIKRPSIAIVLTLTILSNRRLTPLFLLSCYQIFLLLTRISDSTSVPLLIYIAFFSSCRRNAIVTWLTSSFKWSPLSKSMTARRFPVCEKKVQERRKKCIHSKICAFYYCFSCMIFTRNVCSYIKRSLTSAGEKAKNSRLVKRNIR